MIIVKTYDKRFVCGYQIHWFATDEVNSGVITFVKSHAKAYEITTKDERYSTREAFLYTYDVDKDKQVENYRKKLLTELSNYKKECTCAIPICVSDADVRKALQNKETPKQAAYELVSVLHTKIRSK